MNYSNAKNIVKDFWEKESYFYNKKLNNWYLFYDYNLRLDLANKAINKWKNIFTNFWEFNKIIPVTTAKIHDRKVFISKNVYGIDISPNMVKLSREKNPDLEIYCGEISSFDKKVNIVTAIGLVEYLDDINELFIASKKTLTDEGLLIFSIRWSFEIILRWACFFNHLLEATKIIFLFLAK